MLCTDICVFCCSSEAVALALLCPWDLGYSAALAQQALLRGLTTAMLSVLHTLPAKQKGSSDPTITQVL